MKRLKNKIPYVCGPLTELPARTQQRVKDFYVSIADICKETIGKRAFVPHENFDPIRHENFSPRNVDKKERKQIYDRTSLLIIVAITPSWGGGIEVEMANRSHVPAVLLYKKGKKISRLLRGNPSIKHTIIYQTPNGALRELRKFLGNLKTLGELINFYWVNR